MKMSREEQFDFYWKEIFTGLAYNPIEFNTYRFDQSMSLPGKLNKLYEMFKQLALNNQEVMDYLKEFVETFDFKLETTTLDILHVWLNDGKLADIVRVAINEEVVEAREDVENVVNNRLKERLDKWEYLIIDIKNEMSELKTDVDSVTHGSVNDRLKFWENDIKKINKDVLSNHLNVDWYTPNTTSDYTSVIDELILLALQRKTPIYLPEFKKYYVKKDYPSNCFYGNGRLINSVTGKEIQISKTPDNIYQYSQGEMKHKNLYGTFNNAVMQSLMANDVSQKPQILGVTPDNPEVLSDYNNRDNVVQYMSITNHKNFIEFNANEVTYLSDGVIIPSLTESMDIPTGSILDTRHIPFYSGLVKEVDYNTKKITLFKGWYKTDRSKTLMTPPSDKGLTINRTTALWVANWLIYLKGDHDINACTMLEGGIINEQPFTDNVTGIDMLLMGKYGGNNAFQARGRHGKWLRGFADDGSDTSFLSENATNGARVMNPRDLSYLSTNSPVALRNIGTKDGLTIYTTVDGSPYRVNNRGIQNKIGFEYDVVNTNKEINLEVAIHIVTTGVTKVTLPVDAKYAGLMIEIFSLNNNSFVIESYIHANGSNSNGYFVDRKGQSVRLFCDGGLWYKMGD